MPVPSLPQREVSARIITVVTALTLVAAMYRMPGEPIIAPPSMPGTPALEPESGMSSPIPRMRFEYQLGNSLENRPLTAVVLGSGPDCCLIMASIHGNENRGTPIVDRLERFLSQRLDLLIGRRVALYATVNPDGVASNSRWNSSGVDLNRNFPAENRENRPRYGMTALSEPESAAIQRLVDLVNPNRIVSLHEPLDAVDYDGPAEDLADAMAQHCPLKVRKLGTRPGSLGAYAGESLQIPIITLELPDSARLMSDRELWHAYSPAMMAAILFPEPLSEQHVRSIRQFESLVIPEPPSP